MKSLKNRILGLVAVGFLAIGFGAGASQAQSVYKGSFTLDQDVRWQNATMPAGHYTFTVESTTHTKPVLVSGPGGQIFQMPMMTQQTNLGTQSKLILEWRGEELCVHEMDLGQPGLNILYRVPKATENDKLLAKAHTGSQEILIAMAK